MTHFLKSNGEGEWERNSERERTSSGGWLTTHCTGCLEHHGNKEREGLREAEVQGLHLFQQHFNYFGHRRLVKQMHSRAAATNGRNPQRLCCLSFFFSHKAFLPSHICEITATIGNTERLQKQTDNERGGEGEEGGKKKQQYKRDEWEERWSKVNTDTDRQ